MNETKALFGTLRNSADPNRRSPPSRRLVRDGEDRQLCRINVLAFAAKHGLDEEKAISALPACLAARPVRAELERALPGLRRRARRQRSSSSRCTRRPTTARCASQAYEPTLDEMVEVAFTVSPRVRRIAAHDPHSLPVWEYFRQIFWGSGIDLPETRSRRDARRDHASMPSSLRPARRR